MIPAELIKKKRAGKELSSNEISSFIQGYLKGEVADYQMSALLMAIYFQGLTKTECWNLTQAMLHSGSVVKFGDESNLKRPRRVDKHSTGGVGDKTSLVIAPIAACAGIQVPMISGRGLGHTGGTLDKLESIPGFNVNLSEREFTEQVKNLGVCFIGQTQDICPADKKMYALRDVTGTVESIPLICSSIMSKKLAEGIDGLVMDIKAGSGAFMKSKRDAMKLARAINEVGKLGGKKVSTLITNMSQPLGFAVGNMLEVQECLEVLSGKGAGDLRELCLRLAGQMIYLGGKAKSAAKGYSSAQEILDSGAALALFKKVVSAQGGKLERLSPAPNTLPVLAEKSGYVHLCEAEKIGIASLLLGAGRRKVTDQLDPRAGIIIHKKVGDRVEKNQPLLTLHFDAKRVTESILKDTINTIKSAYLIRLQKCKSPRLILGRIK